MTAHGCFGWKVWKTGWPSPGSAASTTARIIPAAAGRAAAGRPADDPSDRSLLARFRGGEPDAFTRLYFRYARRLQALAAAQTSPDLARRAEPEEIVQSVFRTFFRRVAEGHYDV